MTYRISSAGQAPETILDFEGVLDRAALVDLAARCEALARRGTKVRVLLRTGTRVETGILDELTRLEGISLSAESAFLARWIESCRKRRGGEP